MDDVSQETMLEGDWYYAEYLSGGGSFTSYEVRTKALKPDGTLKYDMSICKLSEYHDKIQRNHGRLISAAPDLLFAIEECLRLGLVPIVGDQTEESYVHRLMVDAVNKSKGADDE